MEVIVGVTVKNCGNTVEISKNFVWNVEKLCEIA